MTADAGGEGAEQQVKKLADLASALQVTIVGGDSHYFGTRVTFVPEAELIRVMEAARSAREWQRRHHEAEHEVFRLRTELAFAREWQQKAELADEMAEWIELFGGDFEWSDDSGAMIQDEGIKDWLARHAALTAPPATGSEEATHAP